MKSLSLLALGLAAIAGATMAVQGAINTSLSKVIGLVESTLIVHITGLLTSLLILGGNYLYSGHLKFNFVSQAPWYSFLGGILGVIIIFGVGNATTSIIAGQLLTAFVIDCFGFFGVQQVPFHWLKIVGLILIAAGARLILCK